MTIKKGSRGDDVKKLQTRLNLYPDGIFGPLTDEAVREFQKQNGLVVDGIVGEKTWSKLFTGDTAVKNPRNIKEIIIHCSATIDGKDFTVEDIRRWHLERGFSDIGYHWVIYRDGSLHAGRPEKISGAHCTGHNSISIGICYIGGLDKNGLPADTRTPQQKAALTNFLEQLHFRYPDAKIYGHRDFAAKACPCFDAQTEYNNK